jgi:hypothetical protein
MCTENACFDLRTGMDYDEDDMGCSWLQEMGEAGMLRCKCRAEGGSGVLDEPRRRLGVCAL